MPERGYGNGGVWLFSIAGPHHEGALQTHLQCSTMRSVKIQPRSGSPVPVITIRNTFLDFHVGER